MNSSTEKKIDIEITDYPAIKKLAEALWKQDATYHGAAIMVGSGFSRSAAISSDTTQKLPLWSDLSRQLAKALEASPNSDPLRLAEEYQAYFGKQAIRDLAKSSINDAGWLPGHLHKSLLELPWTDVLTTNWDTLLERASKDAHQLTYTVVTKQEDLPGSHPPRIVKLHGTIGVTEEFTFTQEDYRKYPSKHAAFVNLARQVFIENELCLLGFSGDDPNFLQWAGWVRDQLATSARRIYLVGALDLKPARRRYLESINVSPIDLASLVKEFDDPDVQHARATEYFINALIDLKPKATWDWAPADVGRTVFTEDEIEKTHSDPAYGASRLEKQLPLLQQDRESYPGWIVAPSMIRMRLDSQIRDPYPTKSVLDQLNPEIRPSILFEIAWRHRISYRPLSLWLAKDLLAICDPEYPTSIPKKMQLEIAEILLRNTRHGEWDEIEAKSIYERSLNILNNHGHHWDEAHSWLAYHQAISARDDLDFQKVDSLVGKIYGRDPIWKLRRASLLSDLGRFEEGEQLILESHQELLRQFRENRNSVFVISRLAWSQWLKRAIQMFKPPYINEQLPAIYKEFRTDPFELIFDINEEIDKEIQNIQKSTGLTPNFEAGSYKDNSQTVRFCGKVPSVRQLDHLSFDAGAPMRWENVSLLIELVSKLLTFRDIKETSRLSLAIRSASTYSDELLNKSISRIGIAKLEMKDVTWLKNQAINAIDYLIDSIISTPTKTRRLHSQLDVLVEALGRICLRLDPASSKDLFLMAMRLGSNKIFQNHWSGGALERLVENSLKCIPIDARYEVILEALSFPLEAEIEATTHDRWPNPVIDEPGERPADIGITIRISQLIEYVATSPKARTSALVRLIPLVRREFLNTEELNKLGNAIWSLPKGKDDIPVTGLFRSALLILPSPDPAKTFDTIRHSLFNEKQEIHINEEALTSMIRIALDEVNPIKPNAGQAAHIFDHLVSWRPKVDSENPLDAVFSNDRVLGKLVGQALGQAITPSMSSCDLTEERFENLLCLISEANIPSSLTAAIAFHSSDRKRIETIARIIRSGLLDARPDYVAHASYALWKWREKANIEIVTGLVTRLIHMIEAGRSPNMAAQLWTCEQLLKRRLLRTEDIDSLIESIPAIYDGLDYKFIDPAGREAIDASMIRAACANLARTICNSSQPSGELKETLRSAKNDALPEVRFAASGTT